MIPAVAIVTKCIFDSPIRIWMEQRCLSRGVDLECKVIGSDNLKDYKPWFRSCKNIMTWGCKMPHSWLTQDGQNVLFVENGLINQRAGLFVDSGGYFDNSNLCCRKTWQENHSNIDLESIANNEFGWVLHSGGNPDGPILVALQQPRDATVKFHFTLGEKGQDKVHETLKILAEHLPRGRPVMIRPHPRERSSFSNGGHWRDDWTLDIEGTLADRLPQCSALVTVNSTCATEAALLGIPTATLGTGAFTGSGTTLECADNASKLSELFNWHPDLANCTRYLQAIRGRHFLPYNAKDADCAEFDAWLDCCKREPETVESILARVLNAPEKFKTRPHIWHRYLAGIGNGACLEFGVFKGRSINYMADARPDAQFHGFDSFQGLPEDWLPNRPAGYFSTGDAPLKFLSNITIHKGWFSDALPSFIQNGRNHRIEGIHIDCDLGSSTATILELLTPLILESRPMLLFDEFYGYKGFEKHEILAFTEWVNAHRVSYRVIGVNSRHQQALIQIL